MPSTSQATNKKTTAAKAPADPLLLVKRVVDANPSVPIETLRKKFMAVVRERDWQGENDLSLIIADYFERNYRRFMPAPAAPKKTANQKQAAKALVEEKKAQVVSMIQKKAELMLMDIVLPNGKTLRESTGADCRKVGGWMAEICKAVKPQQVVSDVLSEHGVRHLYSKWKG